jgi:hypothetical protein
VLSIQFAPSLYGRPLFFKKSYFTKIDLLVGAQSRIASTRNTHRSLEELLETTLSSLLVSKCKEDKRNRRITQYFTLLDYTMNEESDTQSAQRTTRKRKRSACRRDSLRTDSPLQPDRKRTRLLCSDCENSSSDTSKESDPSSHQSASPSSSQETGASAEDLHASTHEPTAAFITVERGEGPGENNTSSGQPSPVCTNEWSEVELQKIEAYFHQPNATGTNERYFIRLD